MQRVTKKGTITFDPTETYQGKELTAMFEGCEILAPAEWPQPTKALPGIRLDMTFTKERLRPSVQTPEDLR
jgi:hypothetical protein